MDLRGDFVRRYPQAGAGLSDAVLPLAAARQLEALVASQMATDQTAIPDNPSAGPSAGVRAVLQRPPVVLLHGPAGCGKTHTAQLLAAAMNADLLVPLAKDGPGLVQFLARDGRARHAWLLLDGMDTAPRWQTELAVLEALVAAPPLPMVLTARQLDEVPQSLRVHVDEVVALPFPRQPEREALWTLWLGAGLALADDVDVAQLAAVPLAGAAIAAAVRAALRDARAARAPRLDHARLLAATLRAAGLQRVAPPLVLAPEAAAQHRQLAGLGAAWQRLLAAGHEAPGPVVLLDGPAGVGKRTAAQALLVAWRLPHAQWQPDALPAQADAPEHVALLLDADAWPAEAARVAAARLQRSRQPALVTARRFGSLHPALQELVRERLTLAPPGPIERRALWLALSPAGVWLDGEVSGPPLTLALSGGQIAVAVERAQRWAAAAGEPASAALLVRTARETAEAAGVLVRDPEAAAQEGR